MKIDDADEYEWLKKATDEELEEADAIVQGERDEDTT